MAIPSGTTTGTGQITALVQAAYDQYVRMALRSIPVMRALADVKPVEQAMPGSSVVFSIYSDLAQATATLTELSDVSSIALGNPTQVTVTLNEYGSAVTTTKKLNLTSFNDVDAALADIIAYNAADSIDNVVANVLSGGQNVLYGGTATSTSSLGTTSLLTVANIRDAVTELRTNKALPRMGELYAAYVHPRQAADLRAETGSGGFQELTKYVERTPFVAGAVGVIEGAYVVETPRVLSQAGPITGTVSSIEVIGSLVQISVFAPFNPAPGSQITLSGLFNGQINDYGTQLNGQTVTVSSVSTGPQTNQINIPNLYGWNMSDPQVQQGFATGSGGASIYKAIIAGREALAEALAQDTSVVIGPEIDALRRFRTIGWYLFGGWNRLREAALYRIETTASSGN